MDANIVLINFFHEISSINIAISQAADLIRKNPNDKQAIEYHSHVLSELSELISLHLTIVNVETNPEFYNYQQPIFINIHGLFLRSSRIFKQKAKNRKVFFAFDDCDNISEINVLELIKVVPYIIFDNCIKYAPSETSIDISFYKALNNTEVEITSTGPALLEEESNSLFNKGFRGVNALRTKKEGQGVGLYLLKIICDKCNIDLTVTSEKSGFYIEGIPYSTFKIILIFPNNA